jgi:acyl-CoA synthetase (AMP-forming)/AMP-acid ligase II
VLIVHPETGQPLPDNTAGEVWVTGNHVALGYWGREALSKQTFQGQVPGDSRHWLRTGDLGFMSAGELFISGRLKDLLIINGRKHHPEDIETTIQSQVASCAQGACAVFQAEHEGMARQIVVVEMEQRPESPDDLAKLRAEINLAIWSSHEINMDEVVPVRPGRIPRTTSGKVRRAETRELWHGGRLGRLVSDS